MSKPKIGTKWSGKTAASALGTVGILNNSDDTVLLEFNKKNKIYTVAEILSREDFNDHVVSKSGQKGKDTNRNLAQSLQKQFNKQPKSRATKKASVARSPSPAAARSLSPAVARSPSPAVARSPSPAVARSLYATTRRKPKVAPESPKSPKSPKSRETSLNRNLRLVAESQDVSAVTSLHNNGMATTVAKMIVPELKIALTARGLSTKGLKQELVNRLLKALKENTK